MNNEKQYEENDRAKRGLLVRMKSNKLYLAIGAAIFITAGLGLSYYYGLFDRSTEVADEPLTGNLTAELENGEVIATVNGEEITRGEFNMTLNQVLMQYQMQGLDPESEDMKGIIEEIKEPLLEEQFIIPLLIEQKAKEEGIAISDEEINEMYQIIEAQSGGKEALALQMEQMGTTREELENDIAQELVRQEYLEFYMEKYLEENPGEVIDKEKITIEEEKLKEFYQQITDAYDQIKEMLAEEDLEMDPQQLEMQLAQIEQLYDDVLAADDFEEARPQLEEALREEEVAQKKQQKEQRVYTELIEQLRETSTIEISEDL